MFAPRKLLLFSSLAMSDSLRLHGLQHTRIPCLSLSPWVCLNSCPLSLWCQPTISSSVAHFSSFPQCTLNCIRVFQMCWLLISGSQSIGASASESVLTVIQFSSLQSLSSVRLFETPWMAADQASHSITYSRSSLRLSSVESVMPSSHLNVYRSLFLLPSIPPSIRVCPNELTLRMRWPKYWSFSFSIIPSKEIPGLISFRMDWLDLLAVNTTVQKHQFFSTQLSSQSNSHIHTWPLEKP